MRSVLRAVLTLWAVLVIIGLSSCSSSEAGGTVVRMRAAQAVTVIEDGRYTVIDLRGPAAFAAGHVVGAVNIDASAPDFEDRVRELDAGETYLVYARNVEQSGPAADDMVRLGIDRVVDAGGFGLLAIAGAEIEDE
jgi:rhodanese-related sulfurtransferase